MQSFGQICSKQTNFRHNAPKGPTRQTAIINRRVAELLDTRRLDTLYRIGVDEICYRHPHQYLTVIGDHDTGTVVHIEPGRSEQSLANFYARQPDSTLAQVEAVSMDVAKAYIGATHEHVPQARV